MYEYAQGVKNHSKSREPGDRSNNVPNQCPCAGTREPVNP